MKIGVCIKQVPDTEARLALRPDGKGISDQNVKFIVGPYDEFAIEEALKTKEAKGAGEVVVFCVGPARAQASLRDALAMGADRAVHCAVEGEICDDLVTSRLLAEMIKREGSELVFCGRQATDLDNAQVPQMTAALLGWPCVTFVSALQVGADAVRAQRDIEGGGREMTEAKLPALIAATKGLNQPRFKSLKGIMAAKSKPIKACAPADLGVDVSQAALQIRACRLPAERKKGRIVEGETAAQKAAAVVRALRDEAKII